MNKVEGVDLRGAEAMNDFQTWNDMSDTQRFDSWIVTRAELAAANKRVAKLEKVLLAVHTATNNAPFDCSHSGHRSMARRARELVSVAIEKPEGGVPKWCKQWL